MAVGRLNQGHQAGEARAFNGEDDMRRWCSERNERCRQIGWNRWYWVRRVRQGETTRFQIEAYDGGDGEEVWKFRRGKLEPYMNWSEERTSQLHHRLRWIIRQGMTQSEYDDWAQVRFG